MPKRLCVRLTAAQWAELTSAQRAKVVERRLWVRLEMVRLAAWGSPIPVVAADLKLHPRTVRARVKAFLVGGVVALADEPRFGCPPKLTEAVLAHWRRGW